MADHNISPTEITGIVAAVYSIARAIEMGFKKLVSVFRASKEEERHNREVDHTAAQFAEIQRELKIQGESHIQTRISLERMSTRQEDILRRVTGVEVDIKTIKRKTDKVNNS